ncbi:DUF1906 domain-containing protein [Kitasatospora sp. NPDC056138]|uniref:DUF1906 domain-containing protein n=1 Tax=Kitasatospora sp. NPDC056138 TaxID=3345724 RepID=UPI0035DC9133
MRYLGPAALSAASLVLLLATDRNLPLPGGRMADAQAVAAVSRRAVPPTVLPESTRRREELPKRHFVGAGFDACTAPPLESMQAWRTASPYGAVGIYTSGSQRGCDQPRLTADWVGRVRAMGWELVPTHVGLQAPCAELRNKPRRIDPARAVQQGGDEAAEAVLNLQALGLGQGSPVYLDMEAYPPGDQTCSQAVVDFTLGWTQTLHAAGYHSGFYSSVDSGVADLVAAARAGSSPMPDVIWYARWDGRAVTDGLGVLPDDMWARRQRIHQYRGGADETYGGATLNVDRDQLDGLVAIGR